MLAQLLEIWNWKGCLSINKCDLGRVTRGGKGREVSPALFRKLEKSSPILGKNALIVVIRGLSFSFKLQFLRVRGRKNWKFFPAGLFFLVLWMIVFQSALMIPRKLPCSKKFLAASLDLDTQIFLSYVVNLPRILWRFVLEISALLN